MFEIDNGYVNCDFPLFDGNKKYFQKKFEE